MDNSKAPCLGKGIGTVGTTSTQKILLLGSGELGKEVAIAASLLGIEVVAVDQYSSAPAMHVAQRAHVIDMQDSAALRSVIELERPDLIVPELEAIHTPTLLAMEFEGFKVVPCARAVNLTMDREGIRRLAAETLKLPTSDFRFVDQYDDFKAAANALGFPCVVKPLMSSSGKGQSIVRSGDALLTAWQYAQAGGRATPGSEDSPNRVIVEAFVAFDFEITLLTIRHAEGTDFCEPIGHFQEDGDYRESWQPQPMRPIALQRAQTIAKAITENLGGFGVFGVELFIKGDEVFFSEVSPRPHDTGLVTLISQDLSQFALHVRAILGLPIPAIRQFGPSASTALLAEGNGHSPRFFGLERALAELDTDLRLFGKPQVIGKRRVGVTLARGESLFAAREKARRAAAAIRIELVPFPE